MTAPAWTPEPWEEQHVGINLEWVQISRADYVRAAACVNACAGLADPARFVAAQRQCVAALEAAQRYLEVFHAGVIVKDPVLKQIEAALAHATGRA